MPPYRRRIPSARLEQLLNEIQTNQKPVPKPAPATAAESFAPAALRGLGMFLGMTPARGIGASAATELLAQQLEDRDETDWKQVGIAGVTGGFGGAATKSLMQNIGKPLTAAVKGALWGGAAPAVKAGLEGRDTDYSDVALGGLVGGATAGGLAKLLGRFSKPVPTAPPPPPVHQFGPTSSIPLLNRSSKELEALALQAQAEGLPNVARNIMQQATEGGKASPSLMNRLIKLNEQEAAKAAKAQREAQAAEEIAAAREAMGQPKQAVTETLQAPTPGGVERLQRVFKPAKKKGGTRTIASTEESVPTPEQAALFSEWVARGRPRDVALRLAKAGRHPLQPASAASAAPIEAVTATPVSDKLVGLQETTNGVKALEELEAITGRPIPPPVGGRGTMPERPAWLPPSSSTLSTRQDLPAETIPETTPPEVSGLLKIFTGPSARADVMGEAYRAAKAELDINPIAKRYLGIGLKSEAGEMPPDALQRFLSEKIGARPALAGEVPPTGILGAPKAISEPGTRQLSDVVTEPGVDAATKASMEQSIALGQKLKEAGVPVADIADTIDVIQQPGNRDLLDRLIFGKWRTPTGKPPLGGESGVANPELMARLGMGAAGALIGGATDPLDDPLLSAIGGAGLGLSIPSLAKVAGSFMTRATTDPTVPPKIKQIVAAVSTGDQDKIAGAFWQDLPNYLRANMLIGPNTPNNFFAGPWGAGSMAGLELHMAGDPMGARILELMRPANWANEYKKALPEAGELILNVNAMSQERFGSAVSGSGLVSKFLRAPAIGMMAGDIATRNILKAAGMSDDLARRYTLTSEPATRLMRNLGNIQRSGPVGQLLLPFSRTIANIVEQGISRAPIIGPIVQAKVPALAHPAAVQAQQQVLGTAVPLAAMGVGYTIPEGDSPAGKIFGGTLRSAVSNAAGPYSGLASIGLGMGRALQKPEAGVGDVLSRAATEAFQTVPLPTTDIPTSYVSQLKRLLSGEGINRIPAGAVPGAGIFNPRLQQAAKSRTRPTRTRARTARRFRGN